MSSLQDEILRVTGGPTVNDGLATHYSKTAAESLQDAERRWLFAQVAVTTLAPNQDMWVEFQGGGLSVNDAKYAYWSTQP